MTAFGNLSFLLFSKCGLDLNKFRHNIQSVFILLFYFLADIQNGWQFEILASKKKNAHKYKGKCDWP